MPMVGNPESALIAGMSATPALEGPSGGLAASALSMPDTSLSLGVALQEPAFWSYDFDPATGVSRATYPGEVSVAGWPAAGPVSSFNTRSGAVTLSLADVTGAGGAPLQPNRVDNSGFQINQRSYVSGTALAAGAYGHDRWKAGAGGCTYTFPAPVGPSNTITITAGTLQQVVEGGSIVGGNYMLSWTGTAQGRVGAGSYAASPVAVAGIVAGANTTIEFNGGSLGQVKFESGTVATPWFANGARYELSNCQRFYRTGLILWGGYVTATCPYYAATSIAAMRALPTIASLSDTSTTFGARTLAASGEAAYVTASATATGGGTLNVSFSASADL